MDPNDVYRVLEKNNQRPNMTNDGRTTNSTIETVEGRCLLRTGCEGVEYVPRQVYGDEKWAGFLLGCSTFLTYQVQFSGRPASAALWSVTNQRYCL